MLPGARAAAGLRSRWSTSPKAPAASFVQTPARTNASIAGEKEFETDNFRSS